MQTSTMQQVRHPSQMTTIFHVLRQIIGWSILYVGALLLMAEMFHSMI